MSTKNKISRREALKRIGAAVFGSTIASSGLLSLTSCNMKKTKRITFYFTGTGNCLYVARQLGGKDAELLSIPQLMKHKKFKFEADEIGLVYPIYGHMPSNMVRRSHIWQQKMQCCGNMGRCVPKSRNKVRLYQHNKNG